jgi:hypothetical protein
METIKQKEAIELDDFEDNFVNLDGDVIGKTSVQDLSYLGE